MPVRSTVHASFVVLLLASLICSVAYTQGRADVPVAPSAEAIQPLDVGETAPRFVVRTVDGENFDFDPSNLERPVVLLAFRGGWCPYCNTYLAEMRQVIPEIRERGIDVLFLSGDRPEILYKSLKKATREEIAGLDYRILSDANAQAMMALGIAFRSGNTIADKIRGKGGDVERSSIDLHGVLPVPAVFVIDADGVIRYRYTNPNYRMRLPADALLAAASGTL